MNRRLEDLAQDLIRQAQKHEAEAQKLYAAAKILNPNILEIDGALQIERCPDSPETKLPRREQIANALTGKNGLTKKALKLELPDVPNNTLSHILSHDKARFVKADGKWFIKGEYPGSDFEPEENTMR